VDETKRREAFNQDLGETFVPAGGKLTDPYLEQVDYKARRPEVQMVQVAGYGKVEYQFLLSGEGEVTFAFTSLKAGAVSKTIRLR